MDSRQEQEVVQGLRDGKTEAWHALYDAFAEPVWRCVAPDGLPRGRRGRRGPGGLLGGGAGARSFDPKRGSLWPWLSGIARNHVALYFRTQKRHGQLRRAEPGAAAGRQRIVRWLEDGQTPPADALDTAELAGMVRATLSELPTDYEVLLTGKYCDGLSVEQLAGQENCSSTAIRSKLARARRAFRLAFMKTTGDREVH